jgi:hypothetical protein
MSHKLPAQLLVLVICVTISASACGESTSDDNSAPVPSATSKEGGSPSTSETPTPSESPAETETPDAQNSPIAKWINGMKQCIIDHGSDAETFKNPASQSIGVHAPPEVASDIKLRDAYFEAYGICIKDLGQAPGGTQEDIDSFIADVETF